MPNGTPYYLVDCAYAIRLATVIPFGAVTDYVARYEGGIRLGHSTPLAGSMMGAYRDFAPNEKLLQRVSTVKEGVGAPIWDSRHPGD